MVKSASVILPLLLILNMQPNPEASPKITPQEQLLRDSVTVGTTAQEGLYQRLKERFPDCKVEVFVDNSIELTGCLSHLPGSPLGTVLMNEEKVEEVVFKYEKPENEKDDSLFKQWFKVISKRYGKPSEYFNPSFGDRRAVWQKANEVVVLFEPLNSMDGFVEVTTKKAYEEKQKLLKSTMQNVLP